MCELEKLERELRGFVKLRGITFGAILLPLAFVGAVNYFDVFGVVYVTVLLLALALGLANLGFILNRRVRETRKKIEDERWRIGWEIFSQKIEPALIASIYSDSESLEGLKEVVFFTLRGKGFPVSEKSIRKVLQDGRGYRGYLKRIGSAP